MTSTFTSMCKILKSISLDLACFTSYHPKLNQCQTKYTSFIAIAFIQSPRIKISEQNKLFSFTSLNLSFLICKVAAIVFTSWVMEILKDHRANHSVWGTDNLLLPPHSAHIVSDQQVFIFFPNRGMKVCREREYGETDGDFPTGGVQTLFDL